MTDLKLERKARLQFDFEIKSLEKSVLVFSNCHSKKKKRKKKINYIPRKINDALFLVLNHLVSYVFVYFTSSYVTLRYALVTI